MRKFQCEAVVLALFLSFPAIASGAPKKVCEIPVEVDADLKSDQATGNLHPSSEPGDSDFNFKITGDVCGKGTSLLDTFEKTKVTVKSGRNRFDFIPILLTDKREFNCYAVKVRSACVAAPSLRPGGGFAIEMSASKSATSARSTATVSAGGEVSYESGNSQFFLVPYKHGNAAWPELVRKAISEHKCRSSSTCRYEQTYVAEWQYLERLRIRRRLKPLSQTDVQTDRAEFRAYVDGSISGIKKTVQKFIVDNEIGGDSSPYELQDAVLADSGPSFGAHQIDIATNGGSDVERFRQILAHQYQRSADPADAALWSRISARVYERPVRAYKAALLANLYQDWIPINRALRSPFGKEAYNKGYVDYLASVEKQFLKLHASEAYIRKYPWVGFLLIDIDNQYNGNSQSIKNFRALASASANSDEFIGKVREHVLGWTYAKRGRTSHCDAQRRIRNVIIATNTHYPAGGPWTVPRDCGHP